MKTDRRTQPNLASLLDAFVASLRTTPPETQQDETERARSEVRSALRGASKAHIARLATILVALARDRLAPGDALGKRLLGPWLCGEIALLAGFDQLPSSDELDAIDRDAERFRDAIRPRQLQRLRAQGRSSFDARLHCFLDHRGLTEDELRTTLDQRIALQRQNLPPAIRERLLDALPLRRLATYPDSLVLRVVEHYATWSPLVEQLTAESGSAAPTLADQRKLEALLQRTVRIVQARHNQTDAIRDADDAQNTVLAKLIEQARGGRIGYAYEGPFQAWLIKEMNSVLRRRERAKESLDDVEPGVEPPRSAQRTAEVAARLRAWREIYLLAESTFESPGDVKLIWRHLLLQALESADLASAAELGMRVAASDDALARQIGISRSTVPVKRRRVHQRMGAIYFVREAVPRGTQDGPGDVAMLAWIEARWGKPDSPDTLRGLAALARASGGETTLGWAFYAKALVGTGANRGAWEDTGRQMIAEAGQSAASRGAASAPWRHARRQKILAKLRRSARFFLTPIWMLVVWQGMDPDTVIATLLPAGAERHPVETTCTALGGARS